MAEKLYAKTDNLFIEKKSIWWKCNVEIRRTKQVKINNNMNWNSSTLESEQTATSKRNVDKTGIKSQACNVFSPKPHILNIVVWILWL